MGKRKALAERVAAKKKAKKKTPKKKKGTSQARERQADALLMAPAASRISAGDCAAYSVYMFSEGKPPEDWEQLSLDAIKRFMCFGWAAYHALGGLSIDWDKASENIIKKLEALPKRK